MKTDALLKDPVFQLNLLLWMAKEQPAQGYRVRPLFYQWGFQILYIENPFPFPEHAALALRDSGLDIAAAPEPDLILARHDDAKALYMEAKANSFGVESSSARQARGHLLASGAAFGEVLAPLSACLLCYVVPGEAAAGMRDCLRLLHGEVASKGLRPGPFSAHGLSLEAGRILYAWDEPLQHHAGVHETEAAVIEDVADDTNPAPLLLVFSDEDCRNEEQRHFYRQAMIGQVRAALLCELYRLPLGQPYQTTPEKLLMRASDGIFQYLGRERQKRLLHLIGEKVLARIFEQRKDRQQDMRWEQGVLALSWTDEGEKEDFLDWLEDRRTTFDAGKPVTGSLFPVPRPKPEGNGTGVSADDADKRR